MSSSSFALDGALSPDPVDGPGVGSSWGAEANISSSMLLDERDERVRVCKRLRRRMVDVRRDSGEVGLTEVNEAFALGEEGKRERRKIAG